MKIGSLDVAFRVGCCSLDELPFRFLASSSRKALVLCHPTIGKIQASDTWLLGLYLSTLLFWPDLSAGCCWRCLRRCLTTFKSTSTTWRLCREPHKRCESLRTSSCIFKCNVFCLRVIEHAHYCDGSCRHLFCFPVCQEGTCCWLNDCQGVRQSCNVNRWISPRARPG